MDKRTALTLLVEKSLLFDEITRKRILLAIPSMEETAVMDLGKVMAAEFDDAQMNMDSYLENIDKMLELAEKKLQESK